MIVEKPWGFEIHLFKWNEYNIKILHIKEGHRTSHQYHKKKHEIMFFQDGVTWKIEPGEAHRLVGPVETLEISWGGGDDDIVRLGDDYGRESEDNNITSKQIIQNKTLKLTKKHQSNDP